MVIGGYSMEDKQFNGERCITVKQHESGWSFFLQGEAAQDFCREWEIFKLTTCGLSFEDFLYENDYNLWLQ
jgi:hypothetical protein|tara:strand:- start:884 stop:1096 length:213 start_codon:yes stop_codon:yes gene_type:complete